MRYGLLASVSVAVLIWFWGRAGAQTMQQRLQQAVEAQEWVEAITLIDQMLADQPNNRDQLLNYRQQLVERVPAGTRLPPVPTPTPTPDPPEELPYPIYRDPEGSYEATIDAYEDRLIRGRVINTGEETLFNIKVTYQILDPAGNVVATESVLTTPPDADPELTAYYEATTPVGGPGFDVQLQRVEFER